MNETPDFTDIAKFQPKQEEAWFKLLDPTTKYELFGGSMAGGKSYLLRWAAVGLLMYYWAKYHIPDVPVGLFSEDYPTLKDRQISRIEREFPKWLGEIKENKIDGLAFTLRPKWGGGRILLRNLDDPSKYMSSEFAAEFMEESTRNSLQTFQDLRNRLRYPGIEEVKFLAATNPGGIGHGWNKKYFVDKDVDDPEKDRFVYIHANAYDNKYISETYIKQLESLPEQQRKAYLDGSWDIFAGQFFPEFDKNIHEISPLVPSDKYVRFGSMDWGYEAPFCFLGHIIKPEKWEGVAFNRIITYTEIYANHHTPEMAAERIGRVDLSKYKSIRCDPAMFHTKQDGSMSIADKIKQCLPDYSALFKPANNDREGGWALMHNWLSLAPDGLPYWVITSNCKNLIRTLPQLIHDENKIEDVDSDGDDHAPDSARYGLVHEKYIDAKVGGVGGREKLKIPSSAIITPDGRQVSLDIDKFSTVLPKNISKPYYK